jgi:hypothetical protein
MLFVSHVAESHNAPLLLMCSEGGSQAVFLGHGLHYFDLAMTDCCLVRNTPMRSSLLKPFDPALIRRVEVSSRVNLVKNDDPTCARPVWREIAAGE